LKYLTIGEVPSYGTGLYKFVKENEEKWVIVMVKHYAKSEKIAEHNNMNFIY